MKALSEVDSVTRKRIDKGDFDHHLCIFVDGTRIGKTDKVRWLITTCDEAQEYEPEYIAEILEKVIEVIRS